jgi:hypothetical protein
MGLACWLGKPTTDYVPMTNDGLWERGDIWVYTKRFGSVRFVTGYEVYRRLDGSFQAAPIITLKRLRDLEQTDK